MSKIRVVCPRAECRARFEVDESLRGKKGRCSVCKTVFVLAAAPTRAAPRPDPAAWEDGKVLLGQYVVERKLGQGGMGAVYRVRPREGGAALAVKKILLPQESLRRAFLDELQVWIGLPEHPHLVACRFFRTVGEDLAIFAELVEGGSVADRLRDRTPMATERLLDVAIQLAWGLHALHEWGLVHQDVKPGNALLTADGVVKVSDFGLARARSRGGDGPGGGDDPLVSAGGMTRAYRSPEQAAGQRLSRATDVWSWGVSVLELFTGEVTWMDGQAAAEALALYREAGPDDPGRPAMPDGVAAVLARCFEHDPARRWPHLAAAAAALADVYRAQTGRPYPRHAPPLPDRRTGSASAHDRRTITGVHNRGDSRKAGAAYDQSVALFERLVDHEGLRDLRPELGKALTFRAKWFLDAGDRERARREARAAVTVLREEADRTGRPDLHGLLNWATGAFRAVL